MNAETGADLSPIEAVKYHDLSVPIRAGMPVFEGDPAVEITLFSSIAKGDIANVSRLSLGAHTGTHVDAPFHFLADGSRIHEISLHTLIGPAQVLEFLGIKRITREVLASVDLEHTERVLFKTSNSSLWAKEGFQKDFTYLDAEAAALLVEVGVQLVGVDYLSVEQFAAHDPATHRTLLEAGIVIVEGLNLSGIRPGHYDFICLPLLIEGGDGSPCRAILIEK